MDDFLEDDGSELVVQRITGRRGEILRRHVDLSHQIQVTFKTLGIFVLIL